MNDAMPFKVANAVSVCFLFFFSLLSYAYFLILFCAQMSVLAFIWQGNVSIGNTSSVDSLPYVKVLGCCTTRSKRSLGCPSLRGSWRRLGPSGLHWLKNVPLSCRC